MTPNPAYVAAIRNSVHAAPFPHLIGMTIAALELDSCRIDLVLGERHKQPFGIVHEWRHMELDHLHLPGFVSGLSDPLKPNVAQA
jgi:hypothetical protein